MRLTLAALALSLGGIASAADPVWIFKPGQTFTYECRSYFHYANASVSVAGGPKLPGTQPTPGEMTPEGGDAPDRETPPCP